MRRSHLKTKNWAKVSFGMEPQSVINMCVILLIFCNTRGRFLSYMWPTVLAKFVMHVLLFFLNFVQLHFSPFRFY